jgi:methionine-rich copper-binding protein CopC
MVTQKLAIIPACMLAMGLTACGGGGGGSSDPTENLTVLSDAVLEGDSGTTTLALTVRSSTAAAQDFTVSYAFAGGTATNGVDYTGTDGSVVIAAGQTEGTLEIPVNGDTIVEADETIELTFTADGKTYTHTATITNDDLAQVSIADANANEAAGTLELTVSIAEAAEVDVTVNYATSDGTATAGSDYTASSGTATIPAGQTSAVISVPLINDSDIEAISEGFTVTLSNPSANAEIVDAEATASIADDETLSLAISDATLTEGDAGSSNLVFTVSLSKAPDSAVSVVYSTTAAGTASAGSDFTATSGTLNFAVGQESQTLTVPVIGDTTVEFDETVIVELGVVTGPAAVFDGTGVGTIVNDDQSQISIADVSGVSEGAGSATFAITLDQAGVVDVTVLATTVDGSAVAGSDFEAVNGQLISIPAGQTSASLNVSLIDDQDLDPNETFSVSLSGQSGNAVIADGDAVATIVDNEQPLLSVSDASGSEAGGTLTFTVSLSGPSQQDVTGELSTADVSAIAGDDYTAISAQAFTIPAGQTSTTVTVSVAADGVVEGDETFNLNVANVVNAVVGDGIGVGTISSAEVPVISIGDVSVREADGVAEFPLTLDQVAVADVTVEVSTADATTQPGADFTALTAQVVTIPAGQQSGVVQVTLIDDEIVELQETFTATIVNPTGATLGATVTGTATITDDDTPELSVSAAEITEGDDAAVNLSFTIALSKPAADDVTVAYTTSAGTATVDADYTETTGTATFTAGVQQVTVNVPVLGDLVLEDNETLNITLSNPSANALIATGGETAVGTILDQDAVDASSADLAVLESDLAVVPMVFTVTLGAAAEVPVSLDWTLAPSVPLSAEFGIDYTESSGTGAGTLVIAAGATTGQITVLVQPDDIIEPDETFSLTLAPTPGVGTSQDRVTVSTPSVVGTITNDDLPKLTIVPDVPAGVAEAAPGPVPMTFTISISEPSATNVEVQYDTASGLYGDVAEQDVDFTGVVAGIATIPATLPAGPQNLSVQITVDVLDDLVAEFPENFSVTLSNPVGAELTLNAESAAGIILNDDAPDLEIRDASAYEGGPSSSSVVRMIVATSVPALGDTTVNYASADGTALAGTHYTAVGGLATVLDGELETVIEVPVTGNGEIDLLAAERNFTVTLDTPSINANLVTATATGTIIDDDDTNVPVTGVDTCADSGGNGLGCPVATHPVQDGDVGRGGFSYTNLDALDQPLPGNCVRDPISGLIWELKTNDGGLHDRDNTYTWFNSALVNVDPTAEPWAGYAGVVADPLLPENTEEYVAAVNAAALCGFSDWRLPTIDELYGIMDLSATSSPAIDTATFSNAAGAAYWSGTSYRNLADQLQSAWVAVYDNGHISPMHKSTALRIRLVRDE